MLFNSSSNQALYDYSYLLTTIVDSVPALSKLGDILGGKVYVLQQLRRFYLQQRD